MKGLKKLQKDLSCLKMDTNQAIKELVDGLNPKKSKECFLSLYESYLKFVSGG